MPRTHEFEIKVDDTLPSLDTVLLDGDGQPADLTEAVSVNLSMKLAKHPRTVIFDERAASFNPTADGIVSYDWVAGDTAIPGLYAIEWTVSWGLGSRATFPSHGYDKVRVNVGIE